MEEAAIYPDLNNKLQQLKDSLFVRQSRSVKPVPDEVFPEWDPGISVGSNGMIRHLMLVNGKKSQCRVIGKTWGMLI